MIANLSDFSTKQKSLILILGLLILLLIFTFNIISLSNKNSTLEARLEQEKTIYSSLLKLQNQEFYPKLSNAKSKSIIQKTYSKVEDKNISVQNNNIVLISPLMRFADLLNGLNSLKNQHNITVIEADINKAGDGVVDVSMTFIHP